MDRIVARCVRFGQAHSTMDGTSTMTIRVLRIDHFPRTDWNHADLAAPYWRYYWNFGGSATVHLSDGSHSLVLENAYLIPPDTSFAASSDGPIDHFFIHFVIDRLTARSGLYRIPHLPGDRETVRQLANGPRAEDPNRGINLGDEAAVLNAAALAFSAIATLPEGTRDVVPSDPVVARASQIIDQHLESPMRAGQLAGAMGMSERSLRRRFLDTTGLTPTAYATRRRIDHACLLLRFTEDSIERIADAVGFCDRFHFTRVFTRCRGVSPAAFRRVL